MLFGAGMHPSVLAQAITMHQAAWYWSSSLWFECAHRGDLVDSFASLRGDAQYADRPAGFGSCKHVVKPLVSFIIVGMYWRIQYEYKFVLQILASELVCNAIYSSVNTAKC